MSHEFSYFVEDVIYSGTLFSGVGPALTLVAWVFSALSVYTIAQRRGIRKPWLAWIPVVDVWILGSLSDQYRYVVKGEVKNKRKVLLTVSIIHSILSAAAVIRLIVMVVSLIAGSMQGISESAAGRMLMEGVITSLVISLPALVLSIVKLVFEYMALYDVYTSCDPANHVLYLVLSLIPGISQVTRPLFLFLCRNQDSGMPPRRDADGPEVSDEPADYHYTEL